MSLSPTQLSLRHLRNQGWTADIVETWNHFARVRQDLFGIVDIIAIRGPETLAVQTTTAGNTAARAKKIADSPVIDAIRAAGWTIHIHGWRKNKANRWELKVVNVS